MIVTPLERYQVAAETWVHEKLIAVGEKKLMPNRTGFTGVGRSVLDRPENGDIVLAKLIYVIFFAGSHFL